MSDDVDMAVDGGEVSEDAAVRLGVVAVDGAAASFGIAAEGAGPATGAGGAAGCVDVHAALPDAASSRAAARPSRQALLAEVAERRERVRSLVLTLLKAGIPVELDADVASISADCVGCSGAGEADRGCAGPGGVSDGTAGAGDGRGDDVLAGWPREICASAGDAVGALGPGARSSSEGELRCPSGNGGDGCNGCNGWNGMHVERGVDSDAGMADVRAMDARSGGAGSGRGPGGWPLSSSRPSSASGALLPRPPSGASLSRPGSASADLDEPRLVGSHPPPPPHPPPHPRPPPACPPSSVLPSAAALAALDPREWRVPPLCVPILANVTTFPWASLASRAQFDAVLLDPPWRLATANPTRGVALGYSQLEDRDVLSIPIGALQPMHGLVFLYTINAKIAFSIACLNAWGYELVGEVAWTKLTVNRRLAKSHGFYLQHAKETCLVGRKVRNVVDGTTHDHQSEKNATATTTTTTRAEDDAMEDDALPKGDAMEDDALPRGDAMEDDALPKGDATEDDALPKDAGARDAASSDPSQPSRTPSEATTDAPPESATACPGPGDCSTTEATPTAASGSTATAAPTPHNPPSPDVAPYLEASRRCSQTNGPDISTGAPSSARRIPFPSAETVARHLERARGDAALAAARKAVAARRRALARRAALLRGEEAGTDAHHAGTEKRRELMDAEEEGKGLGAAEEEGEGVGAAEEKRGCGFPLAQTPFASSAVDPSRRQDAPADAALPGTRSSTHPSSAATATPPPLNASAPALAPPASPRTNAPLPPSSSSPAESLASASAPPRYLAPSSDLLLAMRRGQSQKPEETYALIERLVPGGRYLEIFGRKNNLHDGWVTIGNEVTGQGRPEDDDKAVAEGKRAPGAVYGRNMRS